MTGQQLTQLLAARGAQPLDLVLCDEEYVSPGKTWLRGSFADTLQGNLKALGLSDWKPEAFDCDKFARLAWAFATIDHARTPGRPAAGLAFGIFMYQPDGFTSGGHAINVVICGANAEDILFFEPQTQREVTLTQEEIESCYCVII
jgi:hypothetical protein